MISKFNLIPALTVWSDNYEVLFRHWERTLPEGFYSISNKISIDNDGYGFGKMSFYQAIEKKIQFTVDFLKNEKKGKIVLSSDSDIFFTDKSEKLFNLASDMCKNFDMVFMQESNRNKVNGGFYFIKNSITVQDFLKRAADSVMRNRRFIGGDADQLFFNKELKKAAFKWGYIPNSVVAWGLEIYSPQETLFHHATCCGCVEHKIAQQNQIVRELSALTC